MTVDWSMAAVAASLAVFAAPIVWKGVTAVARSIPHGVRRVKQLKWSEIPPGLVYHCQHTTWNSCGCKTSPPHRKRCCGSCILTIIFNRAWYRSRVTPRFVQQVPSSLPKTATFICTDALVILTFALLAETSVNALIKYERREDIVICRVIGDRQPFRSTLTKSELQCLLEGYPPWYRETFETDTNIKLPFPIRDARDIPRGGWVVAVGLMNRKLDSQKPLRVYRCPDEPAEPGWRMNGRTFRMAIVRCRDHIVRNIRPHFVNDPYVNAAVEALNYLIEQRTGSGIHCAPLPSPLMDGVLPLKASDCRFLMNHFNEYSALTDPADMTRYSNMMLPAMTAVVHGAFEVVQYLKDVGKELEIPPELANLQQEIYLKMCDI